MARTYIPTFHRIAKWLCRYAADHGDVIRAALDPSVVAEFDNLREACTAFLDAYGVPPIGE